MKVDLPLLIIKVLSLFLVMIIFGGCGLSRGKGVAVNGGEPPSPGAPARQTPENIARGWPEFRVWRERYTSVSQELLSLKESLDSLAKAAANRGITEEDGLKMLSRIRSSVVSARSRLVALEPPAVLTESHRLVLSEAVNRLSNFAENLIHVTDAAEDYMRLPSRDAADVLDGARAVLDNLAKGVEEAGMLVDDVGEELGQPQV